MAVSVLSDRAGWSRANMLINDFLMPYEGYHKSKKVQTGNNC